MGIKIGDRVTLYNCVTHNTMEFTIVNIREKTQFTTMGYRTKNYSHQVLESGGDGISTISLESPLGRAIKGLKEGDLAEYRTESGIFKWKIVGVNSNNDSKNIIDQQDNDSFNLTAELEKNICPQCGSNLVLRVAKRGVHAGNKFYGCTSFPKCRYIVNV